MRVVQVRGMDFYEVGKPPGPSRRQTPQLADDFVGGDGSSGEFRHTFLSKPTNARVAMIRSRPQYQF